LWRHRALNHAYHASRFAVGRLAPRRREREEHTVARRKTFATRLDAESVVRKSGETLAIKRHEEQAPRVLRANIEHQLSRVPDSPIVDRGDMGTRRLLQRATARDGRLHKDAGQERNAKREHTFHISSIS